MQFRSLFRFGLALFAACSRVVAQQDSIAVSLNMANQARLALGLQPLSWNPTLVAWAQLWANQMAIGAVPFSHAQGQWRPQQGENLYQLQTTQYDPSYDSPLETSMQSWLSEASLYTGLPVTGSEPWLHWSQLVWPTTTQIGCAWAYSISNPYTIFVDCRFYPEGNTVGQRPF